MPRASQGPGGGPRRRQRTQYRTIGNTIVVFPSEKGPRGRLELLPANWRELLILKVDETCRRPPEALSTKYSVTLHEPFPTPKSCLPPDSLPTSFVSFSLSLNPEIRRIQTSALEMSLRLCDVNIWPIAKPKTWGGLGSERFINTRLPLHNTLLGDVRHAFNPFRLAGLPEIDWRHLEQYMARRGQGRYLGIKTVCDQDCSCRRTLPDLWQFGWEMHY